MPRPCQAKIVNVNGNFRNGLSKCFESLILERLSISPRGSWRSNKLFASSIRVFSFDENVVQFEVLRRELALSRIAVDTSSKKKRESANQSMQAR